MNNSKNFEIEIRDVAFGGDGIGHLDGKVCFVEGALPGERVVAKPTADKKNFLRAKAISILEASPMRQKAPCRYYGYCGGCQYQHVSYPEELRFKAQQVFGALERDLGIDASIFKGIASSKKEYRYRNSITVHRTQKKETGPQAPGFVAMDNIQTIAITDCLLVSEPLNQILTLRHRFKNNTERLTYKISSGREAVSDQDEKFIRMAIGNETLLASSKGFFQVNPDTAFLLTEQVRQWTEAENPDTFFDVYCGVGTFSFLSAAKVPEVFCIEDSLASLAALKMNRSEIRAVGLEIIEGRAEDALAVTLPKAKTAKNMLCVDPPRAGLDARLAKFIAVRKDIQTMVYVSCDLATLIRDLKVIAGQGNFEIKEVRAFDMFPRTKHVEVAILLKNKK